MRVSSRCTSLKLQASNQICIFFPFLNAVFCFLGGMKIIITQQNLN